MIFGEAFGKKKINIKKISLSKYGKKKTEDLLSKTGPENLYVCDEKENSLTLSNKAWKNLKKKK